MKDFPEFNSTVEPFPTQKTYLTPFPTERLIADLKRYRTNSLTSNNSIVTVPEEGDKVDATARRLIERLKELSEQRGNLQREERSILTALAVAGVRPEGILGKEWPGELESNYSNKAQFANKSLREACEIILKDHLKNHRTDKTPWLSKAEIEYLIVRGGYKFATSNSKNSVGITLQRMAEEGLIEVQRVRGQQGNRYRWPSEEAKKK
jgi:hypothetical protein